jgi:hypothetical protein
MSANWSHHVELPASLFCPETHWGNKGDSLAVLLTSSNADKAAKHRHAPDTSRISHTPRCAI